MTTPHTWTVDAAELYEEFLVPALFGPFARRLVDRAAPQRGDRVLDVACGTGAVARLAAARGAVTTGTDVNPAMLDVARSVAPSVEWRVADATETGPPEEYDFVFCQQGLQFLPDRAAALAAWRRAIRPGGQVGISVWRAIDHQPGYLALANALDRVAGAEAGAVMRAPFTGPARQELGDLLDEAGFRQPTVTIDIGVVRFPSPAEFLRRQVAASPLRGPVGALPEERRSALTEEVAVALTPFTDDHGVVFPLETLVASAS